MYWGRHQLSTDPLLIEDASLTPSSTVRGLCVVLQSDMSMTSHVNQIVGRCFRQLRLIKSCVKTPSFEAARTVVNSFVISRVDYCNSLLAEVFFSSSFEFRVAKFEFEIETLYIA